MKPSDEFKKTIEAYIKNQAETDPLFAPCLEKPGKNIDDCCTYIMNCAKKLANESKGDAVGLTDNEVFGMAIHYYQEDKIEVGKPINCKVVVNHEPEPVVLTEEEIQHARREAVEREIAKQQAKLHEIKKPAAKKEPVAELPSLF